MFKRILKTLTTSAGAIILAPMIVQRAYADGPGFSHYGGEWGWGHMLFGSSMMIIALGLVIFFIVLIVQRLTDSSDRREPVSPEGSPQEILRQRFARGDVDKEEFDVRMSTLSN